MSSPYFPSLPQPVQVKTSFLSVIWLVFSQGPFLQPTSQALALRGEKNPILLPTRLQDKHFARARRNEVQVPLSAGLKFCDNLLTVSHRHGAIP